MVYHGKTTLIQGIQTVQPLQFKVYQLANHKFKLRNRETMLIKVYIGKTTINLKYVVKEPP